MIKNSNNKQRNFVPVHISKSLNEVNRKILNKFGKIDYIIHTKWSEIVGSFFVNHSEPIKISSVISTTNENGEDVYDKYLHINVTPAAAIEFQHFQDKIIEKINSYFGYKAIKGIKIRQQFIKHTNFDKKNKKNLNLIKKENSKIKILEITKILSNKELQESIVNLGLSINKEDE